MADQNNKFSIKKIAKGAIDANMKLWGGDKIPILNTLVSIGFSSEQERKAFFDKFKVPVSDRTKINRALTNVDKSTRDLAAAEHKFIQIKNSYTFLITNFNSNSLALRISNPTAFTSTTIHNINSTLATRIGVYNFSFYAVKQRELDPAVYRQYMNGINDIKKQEQELVAQLNIVNKTKKELLDNQRILNRIIISPI